MNFLRNSRIFPFARAVTLALVGLVGYARHVGLAHLARLAHTEPAPTIAADPEAQVTEALAKTPFPLLEAPVERVGAGLEAIGGETIGLETDRLEVDVAAGTALLEGHVNLTKGDLKVSCPKVDLAFDTSPKVKWVKASGGVAADVRGVHAEAPEAYVDLEKKHLELKGGVKLQRGGGLLEAEKATIDLTSGKVTLTKVKGSIPVPK
jgi:lipopolysaccharide transport protein LptA